MNRTIFIIILTLLPCCFSNLMAQGTLHGRILSSEGGGVEYATVGVVDSRTPHGATADDRGFYSLTVRETDSVTLRISCSGYETQTLRLKLTKGEKRRLDLTLKPSSTQLDPVTVSDDRIRSTTFTQIDIKRIENSIGPNEGVESYIKTLPDVSSNNELSSQYSVRGGSFDENLVYINGVEIYRPQLVRSGQQEGLSIINPDLVDHLLFSPGGFDATYGDRMSSVLDIIYSRPVEQRYRLALSLLGGSASAQGTLGKRLK